jgi:hypothetical protein
MGKALRLSFICVICFGRSADIWCRTFYSSTFLKRLSPKFFDCPLAFWSLSGKKLAVGA